MEEIRDFRKDTQKKRNKKGDNGGDGGAVEVTFVATSTLFDDTSKLLELWSFAMHAVST